MTVSNLEVRTRSIWAKTSFCEDGLLWLPLHQHLDDAAEIAVRLFDSWLSKNAKRVIETAFNDIEQARAFVAFLAGIHDIGKATPGFEKKNTSLAQRVREAGLSLNLSYQDARVLHHAIAGQLILERYLDAKACEKPAAQKIASVIGAHHGTPPLEIDLENRRNSKENTSASLGDSEWEAVQDQLIDSILKKTGFNLKTINLATISQSVLVLVEGLVVLADWIASNSGLFRLFPLNRTSSYETDRPEKAWLKLELPPFVGYPLPEMDTDELFQARFNLGKEAHTRPVQVEAVQAALTCDLNSLLVIEAPPGEGKTEAALMAAEILAARTGASGFHIAMPTQATTDAMFKRIVHWLERIPGRESSIALLHGNASMNKLYKSIQGGREIDPETPAESKDRDGLVDKVYTHGWMVDKRKSPLSEVVVGTIDQLLFVALQARHLALRHLGISNKVVIVDECHAYDAYMKVYLEMTLKWLGVYGVPVILLSATLPERTKQQLMDAYKRDSLTSTTKRKRRSPLSKDSAQTRKQENEPEELKGSEVQSTALSEKAYPLITASFDGNKKDLSVKPSGRGLSVHIHLLDDDMGQLKALLEESLEGGGCALVLRNTVKRAQSCYDQLEDWFGAKMVSLMHSRFLACDRVENDGWLVQKFGNKTSEGGRPEKHIVVATQVVEQSLDVDFDLLITDLAPMDLLLQRMGRLHRHNRQRPGLLNEAHCYITAVEDWSCNPIVIERGCSRVYSEHSLYRSGSLLRDICCKKKTITFPSEIPLLVEKAYSEEFDAPESWESVMETARETEREVLHKKKSDASAYCLQKPHLERGLNFWVPHSLGNADQEHKGQAQVRDINEDSLEVLALCKVDGSWSLPPWVDPEGEWEGFIFESGNLELSLAEKIRSCMIRLPAFLPGGITAEHVIATLEKDCIDEWQSNPLLKGQLILPFKTLMDVHGSLACHMEANEFGLRFIYSRKRGLTVETDESDA